MFGSQSKLFSGDIHTDGLIAVIKVASETGLTNHF